MGWDGMKNPHFSIGLRWISFQGKKGAIKKSPSRCWNYCQTLLPSLWLQVWMNGFGSISVA